MGDHPVLGIGKTFLPLQGKEEEMEDQRQEVYGLRPLTMVL